MPTQAASLDSRPPVSPTRDTGGLLTLAAGQADVWVAFVDEAFDALGARMDLDVMSPAEWEQHDRFVFEKDRRRYRITRLLVRCVLSRYVPVAPRDWVFGATAFGRPFIANDHPAAADLRFNLSHSDQVVMLAITHGMDVGIDVEDLGRRVPLDVAGSFFAADEVRQLDALPLAMKPRRFLDFWTLKESYIKARGKGLSLPLSQFAFDLERAGGLRLELDPRLQDTAGHWSFWAWQPSAHSLAALCLAVPAGTAAQIQGHRAIPFVSEEAMAFHIQRSSAT